MPRRSAVVIRDLSSADAVTALRLLRPTRMQNRDGGSTRHSSVPRRSAVVIWGFKHFRSAVTALRLLRPTELLSHDPWFSL